MDSIPESSLLKSTCDTLFAVRQMYGLEKPGQMDEAINILQDWIDKQEHFLKKDFCRALLETTIISCKGSVERAKQRIDKYCTMRTMIPEFFQNYDISTDFNNLLSAFHVVLLPKMTQEYYRVLLVKALGREFDSKAINDFYRFLIVFLEYLKKHDYNNGIITILDYRAINLMDLIKSLNPVDMSQLVTLYIEGYGVRLRGIHIVSESTAVNVLVAIVKQCVSAKIGQRIHVHQTDQSLNNFIPQEILPEEYGGKEISIVKIQETVINTLGSNEHLQHLNEMRKAGTDESRRKTDKFNDLYFGTAGTFRTLGFD